jgi:arylsulfatase A-like enzyme
MNRIAVTAAVGVAALLNVGAGYGDAPRSGAISSHVIIVSIDGLRPDAIEMFDAQTLRRLMREGAYSLEAETVYPSKTLPSHTSMLTGLTPAQHGITWNTDQTGEHGVVGVPTIFELARRKGFTTAAFFSKAKLRHLAKPGTLNHVQAPMGLSVYPATQTVEDATRYMRFRRPNLTFIHIAEPDAAGHSFGWMSFAYRAAVRRADAGVSRIIASADATFGPGGYTLIVTADHGGNGRDHGSDHADDMQIPWIAWGAGVAPGELTTPIRTMDTAATALWVLGIGEPAVWSGQPVAAAFTPQARWLAAAGATR